MPTPKDDVLVDELSDFERWKGESTRSLDGYQQIHSRHQAWVRELGEIRQRFKLHGYDDYGSTFANESMIVTMLNEFLRGLASADDVWNLLRNNQRRRTISNPGFGSGGIRIEFPRGGFQLPHGGVLIPPGGFEFPSRNVPSGGSWRVPSPPADSPWYGTSRQQWRRI